MDGIDESAVGAALGVVPMAFQAWFTPFEKPRSKARLISVHPGELVPRLSTLLTGSPR